MNILGTLADVARVIGIGTLVVTGVGMVYFGWKLSFPMFEGYVLVTLAMIVTGQLGKQ